MKKLTCKICRRLGMSVCGKVKCALKKRPYPPGVHGKAFSKGKSEFGLQLIEKQKLRYSYLLREKQFSKYVKNAMKKKGNVAEYLLCALETRLDNAIFRLGFADSRTQARHLVGHGHFMVNNKRVDLPSYQVKIEDIITIRPSSKNKKVFENLNAKFKKYQSPSWLLLNKETLEGKIVAFPQKIDLPNQFNMRLVLEYYSR